MWGEVSGFMERRWRRRCEEIRGFVPVVKRDRWPGFKIFVKQFKNVLMILKVYNC